MKRTTRPEPRTFYHFPEASVCPICGTADDGKAVLVALRGKQQGNITEAIPMHLGCALIQMWDEEIKIGISRPRQGVEK